MTALRYELKMFVHNLSERCTWTNITY